MKLMRKAFIKELHSIVAKSADNVTEIRFSSNQVSNDASSFCFQMNGGSYKMSCGFLGVELIVMVDERKSSGEYEQKIYRNYVVDGWTPGQMAGTFGKGWTPAQVAHSVLHEIDLIRQPIPTWGKKSRQQFRSIDEPWLDLAVV